MKKISLLILTISLITTACNNKNAYTLTGKFEDNSYDKKTLHIKQINSTFNNLITIDSVMVDKNQFIIKGIASDTPVIRFIELAPNQFARFIVEPGNIELNMDAKLIPIIKGTSLNNSYQEFCSAQIRIHEKISAFYNNFNAAHSQGSMTSEKYRIFEEERNRIMQGYQDLIYNFIKPNMNNPVGEVIFSDEAHNLEDSVLGKLLSVAQPNFKALKQVQKLEKKLEVLQASAIGKPFINIKGQTPDGKEIALSDYAGKGKVVLLDFWASWCGPCMKELPEVVKLYEKYKDKGLEIVGVSLDKKSDDWKNAIEKNDITWPQLSNLKGWEDEAAAAYAVDGIPRIILIDKNGVIIEKKIPFEMLQFKLEELLK